MRSRYFFAALLLAIGVSFAVSVTFHNLQSVDLAILPGTVRAQGKVLIFGNSVNRTVSRCDSDTRTLPEMIDALGEPRAINISRGGMQMAQMLQIAEISSLVGVRPSLIVIPVIAGELFHTAEAPVGFDSFLKDNFPKRWLPARIANYAPAKEPEYYLDKHYGTYAMFANKQFVREHRESGCPERIGVDPEFEAFIYWRSFLQPDTHEDGLASAVVRASALRSKSTKVVFWIPPVDFDDIASLHGQDAVALIRVRLEQLIKRLASDSFATIDTSAIVPGDGFADRWCGCGHLNQSGRTLLATRLHDAFVELK